MPPLQRGRQGVHMAYSDVFIKLSTRLGIICRLSSLVVIKSFYARVISFID